MIVYDHCKKCKHFSQYYTLKGFHLYPATGKCICLNRRHTYNLKLLEHCDYWEEKEDTFEQTKKNAEQAIYEINEKLHNILEVLELEKNKN